jgi:hypothetical protein
MGHRIKVRVSRLRDIGWTEWDPIGLQRPEGWEDDPAADEYDSYLLQAAGILINSGSESEAVEHLVWAEAQHMGLGVTATTRARAARTVKLLGDYVDELRRAT